MSEIPNYNFGVAPTRSFLLDVGAHRAVALVAGLFLTLGLLHHHAGLLSLVPTVAACAYGWIPISGRSAYEWSGPLLRRAAQLATSRTLWIAPPSYLRIRVEVADRSSAGAGHGQKEVVTNTRRRSNASSFSREEPAFPGEMGRVSIVEGELAGLPTALTAENSAGGRLYTAIFQVSGTDRFILSDPAEKSRVVSEWGTILAATAAERTAVRRLSWLERAVPTQVSVHEDWMASHAEGPPPELLDDYRQLTSKVTNAAVRHEVYVSVQVAAGKGSPEATVERATEELRAFHEALGAAELTSHPLSARQAAGLIRSVCDPPALDRVALLGADALPTASAAPVARREEWDHVVVNGWVHMPLRVQAWPRSDVGAGWMNPLLIAAPPGAIRSVALHLEPVPPKMAERRVRATRIDQITNRHQRAKWGFVESAYHARQSTEADAREAELAEGHMEHRIAAFVCVSAPTKDTAQRAQKIVELAAVRSRLDLIPCYGRAAAAWAACLPLCRVRFRGRMLG